MEKRYLQSLTIAVALIALISIPVSAQAQLARVGPVVPVTVGGAPVQNGFPLWYEDENGLKLELCLDQNGLCLLENPFPGQPISFPENFGGEAFWWSADAIMETRDGGRALLVLALEAAFAADDPIDGDQISFARVRIRIDNLVKGEIYTVIHPFGQDTFVAEDDGKRGINSTQDIGIGAPGDFSGALASRIGPFLTWDPIADAPPGFVGDPGVEHKVAGSPAGNNFFRVIGPEIGDGSPNQCQNPPAGVSAKDCIETDLFSVSGKIATVFGVTVNLANYNRNAATGNGKVNVFAESAENQNLEVTGIGAKVVAMNVDGARYFARTGFNTGNNALPESITVTNIGDGPATAVTRGLTDRVTITRATYDTGTQALTVRATTSDGQVPAGGLQAFDPQGNSLGSFSPGAAGELTITGLVVPPAYITVRSSAGGEHKREVAVRGPNMP